MKDAGTEDTSRSPGAVSADIAIGLLASVVWGTITAVRLGAVPFASALSVASLGFAALSSIPIVLVAGFLLRTRSSIASVAAAAVGSVVPVAVLAAALKTRTHHRALGAVTFAVGATIVLVCSAIVVRRLRAPESTGFWMKALRTAFWTFCAMSAAWLIATVLGPGSPATVRQGALDGMVGAAAIGGSLAVRRLLAPRLSGFRIAPALALVVVCAGLAEAWKSADLLPVLCARAPFTLGIVAIFGCS